MSGSTVMSATENGSNPKQPEKSTISDVLEALTRKLKTIIIAIVPSADTASGSYTLHPVSTISGSISSSHSTSGAMPTPAPLKTVSTYSFTKFSTSEPLSNSSSQAFAQLATTGSHISAEDTNNRVLYHAERAKLKSDVRSVIQDPILSLLNTLSVLIAVVAKVDVESAANLTDAVLNLLPVDAGAILAAVSQVANETAAGMEAVLALTMPAVADALGLKLAHETAPNAGSNATQQFIDVVKQGMFTINQITANMNIEVGDALRKVLAGATSAVFAALNHLNMTLCVIGQQLDNGKVLEAITPCASLPSSQTVPVQIATLNPPSQSSDVSGTDGQASWNIITVAGLGKDFSETLSQGDQLPSEATSTVTTGDVAATARAACEDCDQGTTPTKYTDAPTSGIPATQALTATGTKTSVVPEKASQCAPGGSNPAVSATGPCSGPGYPCRDCLNGWFCAPQETPAQVVPCGLGWACFHCKSGFFCSASDMSGLASATTSTATTSSSCSRSSTTAQVSATPSCSGERNFNAGISGWDYLGCFKDQVDRILVGSNPMDYRHGEASNLTCITHCADSGYAFAGTENGQECWCGSSIKDDAVRLPEASCDACCQDKGSEFCGGSWAISVYTCSRQSAKQKIQDSPVKQLPDAALSTTATETLQSERYETVTTSMEAVSELPGPAKAVSPASTETHGPLFDLLLNAGKLQPVGDSGRT